MSQADDIFPDDADADAKVKEVKHWLYSKGVKCFEPVSLFCDQLKKVCSVNHDQYLILTRITIGNCKGNRGPC